MNSDKPRAEWIDLINESVHTSDDMDIGDIEAVNRNFVVVKRGYINVHYYYIPVNAVDGWDGHVLWLKKSEDFVKGKYERDKPPDPNYYYLKDFPYYSTTYMPLPLAPSRYILPSYRTVAKLDPNFPRSYRCDLCDQKFSSEEDVTKHPNETTH
jgi:hypothetical protein